ncbi:unnamed protein product [Trichobilharzia szidati]|nr:unnamed protein product [Trichobilharzia szidati]
MSSPSYGFTKFTACPAHFGVFPGEELPSSQQSSTPSAAAASADEASSVNSAWTPLIGPVRVVEPIDACKPIAEYAYAYPPDGYDIWNQNPTGGQQNTSIPSLDSYVTMKNSRGLIFGSIGIVRRGGCVFVEKAYHLAQAGAIGVIVVDNKPETSSEIGPLFAMSGDNDFNDLMKHIHIPVVLLLGAERDQLFNIIRTHWNHTHSALNIMLTKEYNLADSFNTALSIMNTEIIREHEKLPLNNIVGDTHTSFQLISHLYQSSSVSMKTLHLNKISDTIGFSISYNNNSDMFHLRDSMSPSSPASSPLSTSPSPSSSSTSESPRSSSAGSDSEAAEDDDVTRTETTPSDSINPLSWSFTFSINNDLERSSYFLPINENNDSLFVGDNNNNNNTVIKGSPKDISIWRDLFDTTLKQIKLNTECQHFMLAVLQISLHKVCPSDSPYYMNQTIQISRRHYELINTCLSELLHLNEKSISRQQEQAQPSDNNNNKGTTTTNSDNNNNNNSDNIVITLQLGFQLISNDDLSSTTIFPPTFSSSPPPSHPVDPHAPAADEAGVSQTTSTPTPAPRKDEL